MTCDACVVSLDSDDEPLLSSDLLLTPLSSPSSIASTFSVGKKRGCEDDVVRASKRRCGPRSGGWTDAEQAYASRVAECFDAGTLPNCPSGATLRSLLAVLLNCHPMRVSKKYGAVAGKRGYRHVATSHLIVAELGALETAFHATVRPNTLHLSLVGTSGLPTPVNLTSIESPWQDLSPPVVPLPSVAFFDFALPPPALPTFHPTFSDLDLDLLPNLRPYDSPPSD